ncbi:MAG: glycerate kinase [Candidatus Hydrogenedentes bacterium]|nr:glycerate kinase [Candidatus Hydrogenedentota bacterium]
MRVVFAPDSFKESASAREVASALAEGWARIDPGADLRLVPMADGGEGTLDAIVAARSGARAHCEVRGPLGDPVQAEWGVVDDTAVMEMATASGLALVPSAQRDPRRASTCGTGQLVAAALDRGVRRIILGIGGSATNDGGAGFAQALGYRLLDDGGKDLAPGGASLIRLHRIDASRVHPRLFECSIRVATDVTNPLCGPNGASAVYGPQKGADAEAVRELDDALAHFASVVQEHIGVAVSDLPGAGAAGGLGAGLLAFARATLEPGADLVAEIVGLAGHLEGANLAITGEGRIDAQSASGKTPVGVARLAQKLGVPVIAVAGALGPGFETVYAHGIGAAISIVDRPMAIEEAKAQSLPLLRATGERLARLWRLHEGH